MAFKINDVRLGRKADGTVTAFLHGLGQGAPVGTATVDPARAGLMLEVFAMGRDCYLDDAHVFQTTLAPWNTGPSPITNGRVDSWEIRIADAGGVQPQLYLSLVSDAQVQKSSGSTAIGWAVIQAKEADMPLLLGLLRSRYCYYSPTGLRNTQILTDIGWTAG
jgi:hypothetical protein